MKWHNIETFNFLSNLASVILKIKSKRISQFISNFRKQLNKMLLLYLNEFKKYILL